MELMLETDSGSGKKKGWEGRKKKDDLGRMKQTPMRQLRIDLANGENDVIIFKRNAPVGMN